MKPTRDIPLGVLLLVLAAFPLNVAYFAAGSPSFLGWIMIIVGIWAFDILFKAGLRRILQVDSESEIR